MEAFQASLSGIPLLRIVGTIQRFSGSAVRIVAPRALALESRGLLFEDAVQVSAETTA